MFCPVCKAEYREGFTRCADCDADLVPSLEEGRTEANPAELLWQGTDVVFFAAAGTALDNAGIPFGEMETVPRLWPLVVPEVQIWVRRPDLERAQGIVRELSESLTGEQQETAAPDEAKLSEESEAMEEPGPDDLVEDWDPEEATYQVWSGEDPQMGQVIEDCLRENGVGCRFLPETVPGRIFVRPRDEARAREIIREVLEAAPPQ